MNINGECRDKTSSHSASRRRPFLQLETLERRLCLSGDLAIDLFSEVVPQGASSNPTGLVLTGDYVFFQTTGDSGEIQLWRTDGTTGGTIPLSWTDAIQQPVAFGEDLVFRSSGQLYRADGSEGAILPLTTDEQEVLSGPFVVGDQILFAGSDSDPDRNDPLPGPGILRSDGISQVAQYVTTEFVGVSKSVSVQGIVGGELFYDVFSPVAGAIPEGSAARVTDGESFGPLPGYQGEGALGFKIEASYGDFAIGAEGRNLALVDMANGYEKKTIDLSAGKLSPKLRNFTTTPVGVFFSVYYRHNLAEVWWTDGTEEGTRIVRAAQEGDDTIQRPAHLAWFDDALFFSSHHQLWKYDPQENDLVSVYSFFNGITPQPSHFAVVDGMLYFSADGGTGGTGRELWTSDGTKSGTRQVVEINPGPAESSPSDIVQLGDSMLFSATHGEVGRELWTLNLSTGELQLLADMRRGFEPLPRGALDPESWYLHNGLAYFRMNDGVHGTELWRTDGTGEGTFMLRDIAAAGFARTDSEPEFLFGVGDWVYFEASDGIHGRELWRTDGTSENTLLVKDILPGMVSSNIPGTGVAVPFTAWNDEVYFAADDGIHGRELWKTDGTEAGTQLVLDLHLGEKSASITAITSNENGVFFFDRDTGDFGSSIYFWNGAEAELRYSESQIGTPTITKLIWRDGELLYEAGSLYRFSQDENRFIAFGNADENYWIEDVGLDTARRLVGTRSGLRLINPLGEEAVLDSGRVGPLQVGDGRAYYLSFAGREWTLRSYAWGEISPKEHLQGRRGVDLFPTENGNSLATVENKANRTYELWHVGLDPRALKLAEFDRAPSLVTELNGTVLVSIAGADHVQQVLAIELPTPEEAKLQEIDDLFGAVRDESTNPNYDYNGDAVIDHKDVDLLFSEVRKTNRADLDLNGTVDFADFLKLSASFGRTNVSWSDSDIDGDGKVGFADFLLLAGSFGETS